MEKQQKRRKYEKIFAGFDLLNATVRSIDSLRKKDTSYNCHCNTSITLTFNVPKHSGGGVLYIPIYARITGMALADDNGKREVSVAAEIGEPAAAKATDSEIYTLLSANYLQDLYADFVAEAINIDLEE